MQQLFQSVFLQALGKAIAESIWQTGLLYLLFQLFIFLFRIKQATVKNFLASLFALGGFAWFISDIILHWRKQLNQSASLIIEDSGLHNSLLAAFTKDNRWPLLQNWVEYKLQFILPYLSVAYLFVLAWFTAKLIVQLYSANSLRSKGILPVSNDLQSFFLFLVDSMGLRKNIQLFISTQIDIPATLGYLKPLVLLPASAITHLTPAQLEAVLLHELAHIKRNDYFWNLLLSVAETVLFFNPFALLLIGIARRERENSCDDQVMSFQQNAAVYAEALLTVEKARERNPQLVMALGDNKYQLMHRVKRILNLPAEKNKISTRLLALICFTLLFAVMGWAIKDRSHSRSEEKKSAKKISTGKSNPVYVNPDAVVKKNNETVSLHDAKRNIRLDIKRKLNKDEFIVWDEQGGEQMKFDKVIFDDLPATWMERFAQPGMEIVPAPGMYETERQALLRIYQDSLFQLQQQNKRKESALYGKRINELRSTYLQRFAEMGYPFKVRLQKDWPKDSFFTKMKIYPPGEFVWNESFPEEMLFQKTTPPGLQRQKQQAADNVKQQQKKQGYYYRRSVNGDSAGEINQKQFRSAPVFAYLNDHDIQDEVRKNEERIRIIVENNKIFITERDLYHSPDSMRIQQPHPPKRSMKRLEIIRL